MSVKNAVSKGFSPKRCNYNLNISVEFSALLFRFTSEQLAFIKTRGNRAVAEKFEKYLPKYYHRPDPNDPPLIRGKHFCATIVFTKDNGKKKSNDN